MTQIQLLTASASLLNLMLANNIKIGDIRYVDMANEADTMLANGEQKSYVVQHLADKYKVSDRSVYSILDRLHSEVCI